MTPEEVLQIMTWIEILVKGTCIIFGLLLGLASSLPMLKKAIRKRRAAETEEEKAKADLEIQMELERLVTNVEDGYNTLDLALRSLGTTAGLFKKDKVLSDLRDFCDEKGYEYDKDALGARIDEFVAKTKSVNVASK
jgi:hypothetical protein